MPYSKHDSSNESIQEQRQRRKEQNRTAQRAFRERKERYVKELENRIRELEEKYSTDIGALQKENEDLKDLTRRMESEIYTLKGAALAFQLSINKLREAGVEVPNSVTRELSPPSSSQQSPTWLDNKISPVQLPSSVLEERTKERGLSPQQQLFDHMSSGSGTNYAMSDTISSTNEDQEMDYNDDFAASTKKQFAHTPDPIVFTDAKLIPYPQVWERISEHPRIEEFDMSELCQKLKSKAKCSGTGPVIEEAELLRVLRWMDNFTAS
ncbi:uncharacterized protein BYT42DRAFT_590659 [Radiomyces spectabilis]|uniref:uncharacterized protein n=1 Tax=Radiomyces spectabilis TaxID=64574 RepID=UPI00221F5402|nr:uncharacterized protein BYT42DRAFT_590659 [Radiomyces spectabilis]KAI8364362.1 hypothetical protein BYT42DRAFT_590659 [Radiomyces spectabilis]